MYKVYKNSEALDRLVEPSYITNSVVWGFEVKNDYDEYKWIENVTILSKYRSIDDRIIVVKHNDVVYYDIGYKSSGKLEVNLIKLFINPDGEFYFSIKPYTEEEIEDENDRFVIISNKIETYSYFQSENL